MKNIVLLSAIVIISSLPLISAKVWVPEDELHGYFDSNGIYTVVGAVRNTEDYSVLSRIEIILNENGKMTLVDQPLPTVFPHRDIPFKLKFPEITNLNIILENPNVSFEKTDRLPPDIQIIYDKTLVKHDDGHLTGRIINQGNQTEYNLKVYATIHAKNNTLLDVGKNIEKIDKLEPGQILNFTMYPDPLFASEISYYSCFAIGDETIIPLYAMRNDEKFKFRYDSTAAFTVIGFDESGTKLSLDGINSFKVPTYVNFEFPRSTNDEKFSVLVNDKQVKSIQSKDEEGNWHLAFDVGGASQSHIVISGFENLGSEPSAQPEGKTGQTTSYDVSKKTDYTILYYALATIATVGAGIYLYKSRTKLAA
jgi:hypothetical protein